MGCRALVLCGIYLGEICILPMDYGSISAAKGAGFTHPTSTSAVSEEVGRTQQPV